MRQETADRMYWWSVRNTRNLGLFLLAGTLLAMLWLRRQLLKLGGKMQ